MFTRLITLLFLTTLAATAEAATFTVTNANDSGAGSLRAAITSLNAAAGGGHLIDFNGDYTITLTSALPTIQRQVFINAVTTRIVRITSNSLIASDAFGFFSTSDGSILKGIEISCSLAGGCFNTAVRVTRPDVLLWDLTIDGMRQTGVRIESGADNASLSNVRVTRSGQAGSGGESLQSGLSCSSTSGLEVFNNSAFGLLAADFAAGNTGNGIHLSNCTNVLVTGSTVSSNAIHGIRVLGGSGIVIRGNRIGTTSNGATARGNGSNGIAISSNTAAIAGVEIGGDLEAHRNIIAANGSSQISAVASGGNPISGLLIRRNTIGANINGAAIGSGSHGVAIGGELVIDPQVGEPAHPNVISHNASQGVQVSGSPAPRVRISRNSIHSNGSGAINTTDTLTQPVITQVTGFTDVSGTAPTPPGGAIGSIELFADDAAQAEFFVASTTVGAGGAWGMAGLSLGTHNGRNLRATYTQSQSGTFRTTRLSTSGATVGGYSLGVSKSGAGAGTVTSSPAGINCGATCNATFHHGTEVMLTAVASPGSNFTGWTVSGGVVSGCGAASTCTLSLTQARTATATFSAHNMIVNKTGTGGGTVTSNPAGINCGATCSHLFGNGTPVTLTAVAAGGSTFVGWSGSGCSGTSTCLVTISAIHTVTAQFNITQHQLSVGRTGNAAATGTVTSNPAGINCGASCAASYNFGTEVTLTATPGANTSFTGWSGAGCAGTGTCIVNLSSDRNVSANFTINRHTLIVSNGGGGTVTSDPAGIDCGGTCSADYDHGTQVTLTATPLPGRTFDGWTGSCAGTGPCLLSMTQARNVAASFTLNSYDLDIVPAGNGSGTVISTPAGINCGATCTAEFAHGTNLLVQAQAAPGSVFAGYSGGSCGAGTSCSFVIDGPLSLTATFNLQQHTLTVSRSGTGSGSILSSPAGIDCGATCSTLFDHGTIVDLVATPSPGSVFVEWQGACVGSGTCQVDMSQNQGATAVFTLLAHNLSISRTGAGTGTVTSSPAGINCGASCSADFDHGTVVFLTAVPTTGSAFTGWSGSNCGGTGQCVVVMDEARSVSASFAIQQHNVSVSLNGSGSVTSSPAGIDCGSTCSADFAHGTSLQLTATPDNGWRFVGWGGDCAGSEPVCNLGVTGARNAQASFVEDDPDEFALLVSRTGNGQGHVGSAPVGIDCGADCSAVFDDGTLVTLTATADPGSEFIGWSGACIGNATTCQVTMSADRSVTAQFTLEAAEQRTLTVNRIGSGTVTSSPAGIDCGAACQADFDQGQTVTLSASPAPGWFFDSWIGCGGGVQQSQGGSTDCVLDLDNDTTLSAVFVELNVTELLVEFAGSGSGRVTSSPAGIDCRSDDVDLCYAEFDVEDSVTLTATADAGAYFANWTGDCSGSGDCVIPAGVSAAVTAQFLLDGELPDEIFESGFEPLP